MKHACMGFGAVGLIAILLAGGCPATLTFQLPDGTDVSTDLQIPIGNLLSNVVYVEVWNDTDFDVAPRIRFDDDTGFWGQLFSASSELDTGDLGPGEFPEAYPLDCDRVGVIYSASAGQFFLDDTIGQADDTRVLEQSEDFRCGDTIRFHFVGNGPAFGVNVYVNGGLVD